MPEGYKTLAGKCCDNGNFGQIHDCQKKPGAAPSLDTAQQDQPKEGDIATPEDNFGYEDVVPNRCAKCGEICGLKHVCDSPKADAARIGELEQAVKSLLEWVPKCSVGSSGYQRVERVKAVLPLALAELERRGKAECAARKAGTAGGNYPQDCDWPFCGCDARASKVMDTLLECGWIGNKEAEMLRGELDAEAGRVRINFGIMQNLGLVNSIDGWTNQRAEMAEKETERLRGERDALQKQLVDMEAAFEKDLQILRTK